MLKKINIFKLLQVRTCVYMYKDAARLPFSQISTLSRRWILVQSIYGWGSNKLQQNFSHCQNVSRSVLYNILKIPKNPFGGTTSKSGLIFWNENTGIPKHKKYKNWCFFRNKTQNTFFLYFSNKQKLFQRLLRIKMSKKWVELSWNKSSISKLVHRDPASKKYFSIL